MFRTSWVHHQELLCRYCMCRLWYVVILCVLPGTSSWYKVPTTLYIVYCLMVLYTVVMILCTVLMICVYCGDDTVYCVDDMCILW